MQQGLWKKLTPHLIALGIFGIVSVLFFKPALEGKVLNQSDIIHYKGMAQQSVQYKIKYGHYPLWTESAFGGMPAYTIASPSGATLLNKLAFFLYSTDESGISALTNNPVIFFFLACLTFYFLCLVLKMSPWIGVMCAIGFAYATFMPVIIAVGHTTQMVAIAFMPGVIAGFLLILEGKWLWGAAALTILLGLQTTVTQHIQVVYYTGIILGIIGIAGLIRSWKDKQLPRAVKSIGIAVAAVIVAFCTNAVAYLPLQEYAKETMRGGKSELTPADAKNKTKGGLDKSYAFSWSYGIQETATLFVPNAYGGGELGHPFTEESKFADKLQEVGLPAENAFQYANSLAYWGNQPSTAGPVYFGAVICFLTLLGAVFVRSWHKWWLIAASVFAILLAWGSNFSGFNYFVFDHLPFYNKFRAPTMSLIIPQLCFPLLAGLGVQEIISGKGQPAENWKKFKIVLYLAVGLVVAVSLIYFSADFKSDKDQQFKQRFSMAMLQQMAQGKQPTAEMSTRVEEATGGMLGALHTDRQSLFFSDLIRSILFTIAAGLLTAAFLKRKLSPTILLAILIPLSTLDLLMVDRKYLAEENFMEPADLESEFRKTTADEKILADPDKDFRVFDASSGAYNIDSKASYYHNSIGGYSPAKLALYQDLMDSQINVNNQNPAVLNMLNTRYIIKPGANGDNDAVNNPQAFGPCWLVKGLKFVPTADAEMKALDSTDLRDTAVLRESYRSQLKSGPAPDSTAHIKLLENLNDKLSYAFQAKTDQFAVFSEIYYDKGWDAFLDGNPIPYYKVNYVLRGMLVPAGNHTIQFRFEPKSMVLGGRISLLASIIGYILFIAAIVKTWRSRNFA